MSLLVATWNLNHRAGKRPVPAWVSGELIGLGAEVVALTEYVPGQDEPPLTERLLASGAASVTVSDDRGSGDNRILIATKAAHVPGPIAQPEIDLESAHANFLSVTLDSGVIVIGFRMPSYEKTPADFARLWDWLFAALAPYRGRDLILAGDLNADFVRARDRSMRLLERFTEVGLTLVPVVDGVSFRSPSGGTRIDHIFVGGSLRGGSGAYSWEAIDREHPECTKCSHGVPDHALLTGVVEG